MQCRYCRAWNQEEEHRCSRCGRRLQLANARPAPDTYPIQTATAPELLELSRSVSGEPAETAPAGPVTASYQRSLFREAQRVVAIPVLSGADSRDSMKPPRPPRPKAPRKERADQPSLDFSSTRLRTATEAVIYCDAPVALPIHRALAAALDISMIAISAGLFVITFQLAGGTVVLNDHTIPWFGGAAAVFAFFYYLLFAIANGDTPGMHWTQLRLLNFDGQTPEREERVHRLCGKCLSVAAAGLGLLWALVDEEKLTWHDHMSRTFPSPRQRE